MKISEILFEDDTVHERLRAKMCEPTESEEWAEADHGKGFPWGCAALLTVLSGAALLWVVGLVMGWWGLTV
jgi:hypothetical protein